MLYLRSALFIVWFIAVSILLNVGSLPALLLPRPASAACGRAWAWAVLFGLKHIANLGCEVRGPTPEGAVLVAAKHYSMWETMAALVLLQDPAIVVKRELINIPFYGWYARRMGMIPVDRAEGSRAIRGLKAAADRIRMMDRPIVIFPEGTRRPVDAPPDYKPGVAALYAQLDFPCVPMAHNSGLYWTSGGWLKRPGTIVVEFLPAIPPGLPRREFARRLEAELEVATARLVAEGRARMAQD